MVQAAEAERELRLTQNKSKVWFELVTIPRNRRALVYGIVMITLGQLTGINAVMYYLSTLMGRIGFSTKNSVFMSLVGGGSLLIGTIPAILYMDKFGRRVGYNLVGFFVGLVLVGVGYSIDIETNLAAAEGVYLTGLILYMGFRVVRLFDMGCARRVVFVGDQISRYDYLFGIVVLVGVHCHIQLQQNEGGHDIHRVDYWVLRWYCVPRFLLPGVVYARTKGKTLEEIDEIFEKPSRQLIKENLSGLKRFWGR